MAMHSLEQFSLVVEAIYDCALDPDNWREALPKIATLLGSQGSTFQVIDLAKGDRLRYFDHGIPEAAVQAYFETYGRLNPLLGAIPLMAVGEPVVLSTMVPDAEYFESRFYKEWSKPNGQGDLMGMLVLRAGARVATHAVSRLDTQPRYALDELALYKVLAPHICRALTISDALDLETITSRQIEETLDVLAAGVYLIAGDGRVVHMNRTAERQVADGAALTVVNNRLLPVGSAAAGQLTAALIDAGRMESAAPAGGHAIPLTRAEGQGGLIATVLPLHRGRRRGLFAAVAAVFVQDPLFVPAFPGEAFAKLYNLTAAELRVILAMAPGLQPQEVADILGISLTTVKSHLARIFHKTGTSRQADLMTLMTRAATPSGS